MLGAMEKKWAWWLVVIGGVNWGLAGVGYFLGTNLNVVNLVLGSWPLVENVVYILVGLSAAWFLWMELGKK